MSQDLSEQAKRLIDKSSNILIVFKKNYTIDSVASSLALFNILKKQDKEVSIACDRFELENNFSFLKNIDLVKDKLINLRRFIINLHLKNAGVEEFSYDVNDNELKIYITPKNGFFEEKDITTGSSDFIFDLIIVMDSSDLESLGDIYEDNRELFYKVPIINIDHSTTNENFGQINLIDLKSVATSQVIYSFLKNKFDDIDSDIATLILAGIMTKTRAFKTSNVTPDVLAVTSELISLGADRGMVVKNLYQSKNLSTLKLWGRVLARLQQDASIKLVWSLISHEDFVKSGANIKDVHSAV
ncbi:MAG: DHH family phosphoesterase, partial [Patescibacteria group bacterium]